MAIIRLSRKAYFHNLDIIAQKVGDISKIAVVLKDNAYGHGLLEMAQLSEAYGIRNAVVRSRAEAETVQTHFTKILILAETDCLPEESFTYAVNSLEEIEKMPKGCQVELKVDTGMHRNGVALDEVETAISMIIEKGLVFNGVFTHNRSADALSAEWFWQRKNFEKVKEQVSALQATYGYQMPRFHSANSAATFRFGTFDEDMVRVGIAAYGCLEMDATLEMPELQPVLSLHADRIATRNLKKGEHVGYNATFRADEEMTVSTYDLGYADGLLRTASNSYTAPNGERLLGRVSMDNTSFTGNTDELLVFDNANTYAEAAGTIGYEVLVGLDAQIKRVVV